MGKHIHVVANPASGRNESTVVGDGERWGDTPITATVLPSAVSVITPER